MKASSRTGSRWGPSPGRITCWSPLPRPSRCSLFLTSWPFKALGLGGTYLLVAVVALACLYFPLRLLLNYRLQKKALEYQYLLNLGARHGLVGLEGGNPASPPDSSRPKLLRQPEELPGADSWENPGGNSSS